MIFLKFRIKYYKRLFSTVKFLKFNQVISRLIFIPKYIKIYLANKKEISWEVRKSDISTAFFLPKNVVADDNQLIFLNDSGQITEVLWDANSKSTLWKYNLHYFDWINSENCKMSDVRTVDLMSNWVSANPIGKTIAWDPYPTSLRIVNWVKFHLNQNNLPNTVLQSLATQGDWISRNVEWHLMANHLFVNSKAMIFIGLFFEGPLASRLLSTGLKILNEELKEQVLIDGGHFERSPMYHSIFLEDLLDLISLANSFPKTISGDVVQEWRYLAVKMLDWLKYMSHPDGNISFFNDAAEGIAPTYMRLVFYANKIGFEYFDAKPRLGLVHLAESGYIRFNSDGWAAFIDVAKIGPDYQPGHAHADTLSFELSVGEERFFVNSGISEYKAGQLRSEERSTSAHNTVEIDGLDSSEVWSAFRVANRAKPIGLAIEENLDMCVIKCGHNGYHRLVGKPTHWREFSVYLNEITLKDSIDGEHQVGIARYHVHPKILIYKVNGNTFKLISPKNSTVIVKVLCGQASLEASFYCPEFGRRVDSNCLRIELESGRSEVGIYI